MPIRVKFVSVGEHAKVKVVKGDEPHDMEVISVKEGEDIRVKRVESGEVFKVKVVTAKTQSLIAFIYTPDARGNLVVPDLSRVRVYRPLSPSVFPKK